jgi:Spy/CpxP family protein refolding chaperone
MKRILIPLMLVLGGAPAFAQTVTDARVEARHENGERRFERLTSRLGLDAATAAKVRATFEKYRGEAQPARQTMWQSRRALKDELAAASPDQARVAQLTDQLAGARAQLQAIHTQRMAELKSELTPSQYAKLIVERHGFGRRMHHHGRARGEMPQQQ